MLVLHKLALEKSCADQIIILFFLYIYVCLISIIIEKNRWHSLFNVNHDPVFNYQTSRSTVKYNILIYTLLSILINYANLLEIILKAGEKLTNTRHIKTVPHKMIMSLSRKAL